MEQKRKYDMLLLLTPDLDSEQVEKITERFMRVAEDNGGTVIKRSNWGRRSLAYEVNRNDKGIYYLFHLEAAAACIAELNRVLKIDQDVMKFLITRVEKFTDPFGRPVEDNQDKAAAGPSAAEVSSQAENPVPVEESKAEEAVSDADDTVSNAEETAERSTASLEAESN